MAFNACGCLRGSPCKPSGQTAPLLPVIDPANDRLAEFHTAFEEFKKKFPDTQLLTLDHIQKVENVFRGTFSQSTYTPDATEAYRKFLDKFPTLPLALANSIFQVLWGIYGLALTFMLTDPQCGNLLATWVRVLIFIAITLLMLPGGIQQYYHMRGCKWDFAHPEAPRVDTKPWFSEVLTQLLEVISAISAALNVAFAFVGTKPALQPGATAAECFTESYAQQNYGYIFVIAVIFSWCFGWYLWIYYSTQTTQYSGLSSFLYMSAMVVSSLVPLIIELAHGGISAGTFTLNTVLTLFGSIPRGLMCKYTLDKRGAKVQATKNLAAAFAAEVPHINLTHAAWQELAAAASKIYVPPIHKPILSSWSAAGQFGVLALSVAASRGPGAFGQILQVRQMGLHSEVVEGFVGLILFISFFMALIRYLNFFW